VKIGDVVRINSKCDAGGLWHKLGFVVHAGLYCKWPKRGDIEDDGMRADIMLEGRIRRFAFYELDVINDSR
jgi:hypothetical protein